MENWVDGLYMKTPEYRKIAFHISLSFTIEPMSADHELQDLVREFEQTGLPHIFTPQPEPAAHEETLSTPTSPMQTRSSRKQFKPEVRSKQNEDRHKEIGQTSKDPEMNPSGSVEIPPEGDENIATPRPPYLQPVRPGVQPP